AIVLLLAAPVRADVAVPVNTEPGSNITIKISSPVTSVPHFGFMPLRIAIENGTARDGTWRFRFDAGSRAMFPGITTSTLEVDVSAMQTRERWFFVPLASPAITINPTVLVPSSSSVLSSLPATPPPIAGIYPNPNVPGVRYSVSRPTTSSTATGLVRVFTIAQTGPANLLPLPAPRDLPPNATVNVSAPDAAGNVTRTTVVRIEVASTASGIPTSFPTSPASTASNNARRELSRAGLAPPGVQTRTSSRTNPGAKPGTNEVSLTLSQTGPEKDLPLPPLASLPRGFTSVTVNPNPGGSGVVREFTYVEQVATPAPTAPAPGAAPGVPFPSGRTGMLSPSFSAAEAEARRLLAPTRLLNPITGVRSISSTQFLSTASMGSSGGPYPMVTFEQTGPAALLPQPSPATLPPGVKVTVYPAMGGSVTRIITVVEPSVIAAMYSAVAAGGGSSMMSHGTALARAELQRLGLLRAQPGISQGSSFRRSSGGSSVPVSSGVATSMPDIFIFTESGAAAQLTPVPPGVLPAGVTSTITTGPLPGETTRNFVVSMPAFIAGAGGTAPVRVTPAHPVVRYSTGAPTAPGVLVIEIGGPGVTPGTRSSFPNAIGNTAMPPIATTLALDSTLRTKFAASGIGALPNLSAFEPAQAPADWRIWSSFNSVVLRAEDFSALDPARRAALRSWVAMGGRLFLAPIAPGSAAAERVGAGRIHTLAEPIAGMSASDVVGNLQVKNPAPGMPERERIKLPAGTPMGDMVKVGAAETFWVSVLLVLFAVVIGPVNLYWLAPPARRHRLFLTTPLISLAGATGVAVAILLQDGIGGQGIRRALVVLVPGENQAAVFQEQAARTGFLPKRRFALGDEVIAAALPTADLPAMGGLHGGSFARERGQADGDWFVNRSRQAQMLRQLVPTRARIEVVDFSRHGAPIVESTVTTELRDFRLRDGNGIIWGAPLVVTGRRVTLELHSRFEAAAKASKEYGGNGTAHFGDLVADAMTLTDAWQWSGRGGATAVAPIATLPRIRWRDEDVLFAGVANAPKSTRAGAGSAPRAGGAE
ncbi:MAG: hypothetical protein Q7S40_18685, partial [Opitutaceae bacterium]|nr:hypothetical protein [Opitutaceae bacterium]